MKRFIYSILGAAAIAAALPAAAAENGPEFLPVVMKIHDENEVGILKDAGVDILRRRADLLLCYVPKDAVGVVDSLMNVGKGNWAKRTPGHRLRGKAPRGGWNVPTLDFAVRHFGAGDILSGNGFEQAYTGKGVVVGICDIGFDPRHPTFLDENGHSRVKRLTQYIENEGKRIELEGDAAYEEWGTDNADEYHATHVAGILAGNGAGSPYAGIARDAELVVSTSTLSDVGLLAGVEDIIDYGKETGKPVVVNLSMGNYVGAHDGSSLFSQYLDLCADDAVIVLSAGNEGNQRNTLQYTFPESGKPVSFRLGNRKWDQIEMYGQTDLWSGSDSPLSVRVGIFTDSDYQLKYQYPAVTPADGEEMEISWNPEAPDFPGLPLNGKLWLQGEVNPENGRYHIAVTYDFKSPEPVEGKTWANYTIALEVGGKPGGDVEVFADGSRTRLVAMAGNPAPGAEMSVSDLACGFRVVSVGMYGNRPMWPISTPGTEGATGEAATGYESGKTVAHSSYGTLRDRRALPLTVAPGAPLVSAFNRIFLEKHPSDEAYLMLDAPWTAETGTSMSAPYVAGFIATWLEAKPTLKVEDVQRIIVQTNRTDIDSPADPRNACGWFDPAAAMREIAGTDVGTIRDGMKHPRPEDHVEIYTPDGKTLYMGRYDERPALPAGLYIVKSPCLLKGESVENLLKIIL